MRSRWGTLACIVGIAFAAAVAVAQQRVSSLHGSWTATVGTRPAFQGTWYAELREQTPNAAAGTWTLVDAGRTVIASGTWSATRSARAWSGTWSARASSGAAKAGSWRADVKRGPATFADLLRSTLETQLTGAWRSGALQGRWVLKAAP